MNRVHYGTIVERLIGKDPHNNDLRASRHVDDAYEAMQREFRAHDSWEEDACLEGNQARGRT